MFNIQTLINIIVFLLLFDVAHAQFKTKSCWQPPGLPIDFCIDDKKNFEVKASSSVITPLGKFKIQAGYNTSNNAHTYAKYHHQYSNVATNYSPKIRYVERTVEVPKYQYHLYLRYKDEVHVYQIIDSNELTIESSSGFKGKFRNSIVEIEISDSTQTQIIFNNVDVRNFQERNFEYPEKKRDLSITKFQDFNGKLLLDLQGTFSSISYGSRDIIRLPSKGVFEDIIETDLTFNPLGEVVTRKKDYYLISDEDNLSRLVLTTYEKITPESTQNILQRLELYYNKSTFELLRHYTDRGRSAYKYFGVNINALQSYLLENSHPIREDSTIDVLSKEVFFGFSTKKIGKYNNYSTYKIGIYSRFGNDIADLIVIDLDR